MVRTEIVVGTITWEYFKIVYMQYLNTNMVFHVISENTKQPTWKMVGQTLRKLMFAINSLNMLQPTRTWLFEVKPAWLWYHDVSNSPKTSRCYKALIRSQYIQQFHTFLLSATKLFLAVVPLTETVSARYQWVQCWWPWLSGCPSWWLVCVFPKLCGSPCIFLCLYIYTCMKIVFVIQTISSIFL